MEYDKFCNFNKIAVVIAIFSNRRVFLLLCKVFLALIIVNVIQRTIEILSSPVKDYFVNKVNKLLCLICELGCFPAKQVLVSELLRKTGAVSLSFLVIEVTATFRSKLQNSLE